MKQGTGDQCSGAMITFTGYVDHQSVKEDSWSGVSDQSVAEQVGLHRLRKQWAYLDSGRHGSDCNGLS
jgi:hypothetical protein